MLFVLFGILGSLFVEPIVYFSLLAFCDNCDKKQEYINYKSELLICIHVVAVIIAAIISFFGILVHLGEGTPTTFSVGYIIGLSVQIVGMIVFFSSFRGKILLMYLRLIMLQSIIERMKKIGGDRKEIALYESGLIRLRLLSLIFSLMI